MSRKLLSFMIAASIMSSDANRGAFVKHKKPINSKIIIPKNAKLYIFDGLGLFKTFSHDEEISSIPGYIVFHTIATKDENAFKKFKKWQEQKKLT